MYADTSNRKQVYMADIQRSQLEEIRRHKWIESEKAGHDIGWQRATVEWMRSHYPSWRRYKWEQAINEALRNQWGEQETSNSRN